MAIATLTTKGQVTIPKKIRETLKLHTGDKIEIIVTEKREAIKRGHNQANFQKSRRNFL